MANISNIQFLRNGSLYTSKDAAISALTGSTVMSKALDGSQIFARYKEGEGPVKTVYALYYVNGSDKTATIYEADKDDLDEIRQLLGITPGGTGATVDEKIASAYTSAVTTVVGASTDASGASTVYGAKAYAKDYADNAIDGLDVSTITSSNQFIYAVAETNGKISASAKTVSAGVVSVTTSSTITSTTVQAALEEVASKGNTGLENEIAERRRIEGQVNSAYTANATAKYISGATDLNDADVKLNAAIVQEVSDRASAITNAINALDVDAITAGDGAFIKSVNEVNGKVSATTADMPTVATITTAGKPIIAVAETKGTIAASAGTINAAYVNVADSAGVFTASTVEATLKELYDDVQAAKSATTLSAADKSVVVATAATGTTVKVNIKSGEKVIKLGTDGIYTNLNLVKTTTSLPAEVKERYNLKDSDGNVIGDNIDIPKDSHIVSITYLTTGEHAQNLEYKYIDASGNTQTTYVDMSSLVLEAEFASGVTVTDHIAHGVVDSTSESFLTVGAGGFKLSGVQIAINSAVTSGLNSLDATAGTTTIESGKHVAVQVVEKDGKVTAVTTTESDIASKSDLDTLSGKSVTAVAMIGGDASITAATDGTKKITINTDGSKVKMTSYSTNTRTVTGTIFSGSTGSTVAAADTVNAAVGKLEKLIIEDETIVDARIKNIESTVAANEVTAGNGISKTAVSGKTQISAKAAANSGTGITNPITVDSDGIKFATTLDAGTY